MKEKYLSVLSGCYLFESLGDAQRKAAIEEMTVSIGEFKANETILCGESFSPTLLCVLSGKAEVWRMCEDKHILLNSLGEGDCFGAASMFGSCERFPTTVIAKGQCIAAAISEEALCALFEKYPSAAISHIRFLSNRIRFLNEKLDTLTGRNTESKVSKFVLDHYGKRTLHNGINMSKVASSLDIGRASLYRQLQNLAARGIISMDGGNIIIRNQNELERLANKS